MRESHGGEAGRDEYTGSDPRALRAQVERTRNDLGDTVEELASRADVRAIARRRVSDVRERVTRTGTVPLIAAGAVVTVCAAGAMVRHHRHGGR